MGGTGAVVGGAVTGNTEGDVLFVLLVDLELLD